MALTTDQARYVIDVGFPGHPPRVFVDDDTGEETVRTLCEFRDMPPGGLLLSRATEIDVVADESEATVDVTFTGPVLVDYMGDFVLSIEVPDEAAAEFILVEGESHTFRRDEQGDWVPGGPTETTSWPYREYWIEPEIANQYRHTLRAFDSVDGEEVRLDLVGR